MHYLYILYSGSIDRFYIGESKNIRHRLELRNSHHFKKSFTKAATDWKIVLSKKCKSKQDAIYLEKFIKRMKSKKFILKIINDNTILNEILKKR